jgi:hypothetical protein
MDYWETSDADDRRGGASPAARRWAGHVRAFVAGVAITSLVAFLLVHDGSAKVQHLRVGGATDATDSVLSATTSPPSVWSTPSDSPPSTAPAPAPPTVSSPSEPAPTGTRALAEGDVLATCTEPEQGVTFTPTQDEFVARLVGTWMVCNAPSVFGTNEVGMQIRSDGRWSKLTRNPAGHLTPIPGWGNQGTWEIIDTSAMNGPGVFQVNFHVDGSGTVISSPVFSSGPPKMRLNNMGVYIADYVPGLDEG